VHNGRWAFDAENARAPKYAEAWRPQCRGAPTDRSTAATETIQALADAALLVRTCPTIAGGAVDPVPEYAAAITAGSGAVEIVAASSNGAQRQRAPLLSFANGALVALPVPAAPAGSEE